MSVVPGFGLSINLMWFQSAFSFLWFWWFRYCLGLTCFGWSSTTYYELEYDSVLRLIDVFLACRDSKSVISMGNTQKDSNLRPIGYILSKFFNKVTMMWLILQLYCYFSTCNLSSQREFLNCMNHINDWGFSISYKWQTFNQL